MTKSLVRSVQQPLLGVDVFDDFFNRIFHEASSRDNVGFPQSIQRQTEKELTFQFALAGYTEKELSVQVEDNTIIVKGQKAEDESNLFASRAFTWSRRDAYNVWDLTKADVSFKNGLLTIRIPKKESAQPTSLQITVK